ncbi:MAG: RNA polymerase sigma factor [Bacteroidales bacterium]|nr:RNA polymerase sigma factor [Bacteroidales bacterium]
MSIEQDIAERFRRGDSQAGRLLYETYAGWLLGVCLRYVCDRNTAQDLLHDGFLQILTHASQFKWQGEGSLKAWVFRVQHNVILMHLREQEKIHQLFTTDEPQLPDIPEPETVADVPQAVILQMISKLPAVYRTVFNLYVIDGHSHREIAQLLGIKEKTSASQLVHAKRLLAEQINNWRKENQ